MYCNYLNYNFLHVKLGNRHRHLVNSFCSKHSYKMFITAAVHMWPQPSSLEIILKFPDCHPGQKINKSKTPAQKLSRILESTIKIPSKSKFTVIGVLETWIKMFRQRLPIFHFRRDKTRGPILMEHYLNLGFTIVC